MKLFCFTLILSLTIHAMDIESVIDDMSQSPETTFTNPFTGQKESIYRLYEVARDAVKDKLDGKINYSYEEIEQALLANNSNLNLNDIRRNINYGIDENIIDKDLSYRAEAIEYISREQGNEDKIQIFRAGTDASAISQLSDDAFRTYVYNYLHKVDQDSLYEIALSSSSLPPEAKDFMLQELISIYIRYDYDTRQLSPAISAAGFNIPAIACDYVDQLISYFAEDEEPGTLSSIEYAKEDDFFEESMLDNYRYNSQKLAETITAFSDLGFSPDHTCTDGRTINQVITESEEFKVSDIEIHYPIVEEEAPCISIPNDLSIKSIFNGCDISHIIWQLERQDSSKNQKDVTYIWGEEVGDCNIMLMTRKVKNENYMHFRVRNRSGAEKEIYAKPNQIINLISK
ncbi:hypothetical protein [Bacteriovorax sp. Seq25_V]|uniref:hypothetical protein n=1 Tax=Bacteriovorax sp. Seq25_V TaxID=1201288 RepID=UPI000389FC7C|nr:hypothetical protein [Bacteriovorax sp. Seq25_V]EQC47148.1 hypothetical protein M900_0593 [Bacteriovorax sp. Seq25_V]